jgi:hypothetical protein
MMGSFGQTEGFNPAAKVSTDFGSPPGESVPLERGGRTG